MRSQQILIADDDAGMIRLIETILKPLGIEILPAGDAITALSMIRNAPPDLAILDVNMPAGNGLSACEMLMSDPRLSLVPVIILTGESSDRTVLRCQAMRAHYVRKGPDAMERVKQLVCQLLSVGDQAARSQTHFYVG